MPLEIRLASQCEELGEAWAEGMLVSVQQRVPLAKGFQGSALPGKRRPS